MNSVSSVNYFLHINLKTFNSLCTGTVNERKKNLREKLKPCPLSHRTWPIAVWSGHAWQSGRELQTVSDVFICNLHYHGNAAVRIRTSVLVSTVKTKKCIFRTFAEKLVDTFTMRILYGDFTHITALT